ncbi:MAG: SMP-30/gluconolactonase/LRE family protein [Proteobacteria bacterium]|nr:SMP-30/gluconolactonase/LRE family protein [Pseudomonadota bacterium]MCP4921576.1 SMP-30/gluconolactonase/LRE family protein [Pseudomonadota bacterium]
MSKGLHFVAAIGLCALLYLVAWPVPVEPIAYELPAGEPWEPTGALHATRFQLPDGHGPEDVDLDDEGHPIVGLQDGRILRWDDGWIEVADTQGRPLGIDQAKDGGLYVADAYRGLLHLTDHDALTVLTDDCGSERLVFTDDVEVAPDGRVWFTDASTEFDQARWKLDLLEGRPNGRLCVYDPVSYETTEFVSDLHFANGVAVSPDGHFVLVNETSRFRVLRIDTETGNSSVFLDDLPGYPDGISSAPDGYWIAIASPRKGWLDRLSTRPGFRSVLLRLPEWMHPRPAQTARALHVDFDGNVLHDLFDPTGTDIAVVTSVQQRGDRLYLGSLTDHAFASMPMPE